MKSLSVRLSNFVLYVFRYRYLYMYRRCFHSYLFYLQVFSLDTPDAFQFYYNPLRAADRNTGMEKMAEQIATLCSTLGEYPSIRYRLVYAVLIGLNLTSCHIRLGRLKTLSQKLRCQRGFKENVLNYTLNNVSTS